MHFNALMAASRHAYATVDDDVESESLEIESGKSSDSEHQKGAGGIANCSHKRLIAMCMACSCCICGLPIAFVCIQAIVNAVVRSRIGIYGTRVLGVETTVQQVNIGLLKASSSISGVSVASPQGGTFLDILGGNVDTHGWPTLFQDNLHFKEMAVRNVTLAINQLPGGETNAQHIIRHLRQYRQEQKAHPPAFQLINGKEFMDKKKVIVDRLTMTGIHFTVDLPLPGMSVGQGPVPFTINNIVISDIGKGLLRTDFAEGHTGIHIHDLFVIVLVCLVNSLLHTVPQQYVHLLQAAMVVQFDKAFDYGALQADVGQGLKEVSKAMGWVTDAISDATSGATATVADAIDNGINNTKQALSKMVSRLPPGQVQKGERAFDKFVDNPLQAVSTWVHKVKNATDRAADNAGDKTSGRLAKAGQAMVDRGNAGT